MRIYGEIDVFEVAPDESRKLVTSCKNTFVDGGKGHICDWLAHDNYSDDVTWNGSNPLQGGRSIGNHKIIPYTEMQWYRTGTHSYIANPQYAFYPNNNTSANAMRLYCYNTTWTDASYNTDYGTFYVEFSRTVNLSAIMVWGEQTDSWNYQFLSELSTSPNPYAQNSGWTRQNVVPLGSYWGNGTKTKLFTFDYHNYPNRIVNGVKTFRWRSRYIDWTPAWASIYGIWFYEANDYPNTPSVIAIGTDDGTAKPLAAANTSLGVETWRKFVRTHKASTSTSVKYTTRMDYSEGNSDVPYKEAGLFVNPNNGVYIGGDHQADYCTRLMARGVFSTPFMKTSDKMMDIDYTLNLTNS